MGAARYDAFRQALDAEPPVSIRINPFKYGGDAKGYEPVPWCAEGRYLPTRPAFTFDPLLHAGCYYVQEASSMMVAHVVRQLVAQPVLALDLCAAPGGKTTALRTALPDGSLLVSNEPIRLRAQILTENVQKFGHPDMIVTCNYPRDYIKSGLTFDLIVADVPCSGEGMFRKDAATVTEWSEQNVEQCRGLQRSIVADIWPCLREGGLMIYSTCTFNARENEENVAWIARELGADILPIDHPDSWGITGSLCGDMPAMRFIPSVARGEGLFMAVLRKHGHAAGASSLPMDASTPASQEKRGKKQRKGQATATPEAIDIATWLGDDYLPVAQGNEWRGVPERWKRVYDQIATKLHVTHAGVTLGTVKGRGFIPHAALALSTALRTDAFPSADLSYDDAIAYLRKEAITLPADVERGLVVLRYHGHTLGFVKNIGNRANNLYPQEWKIKTTHLPEQPVNVI